MIVFDEVTFTYPGATKPAIQNVNLSIPEGEFVLIVGESGAGKSTFLRCLNGLVPHFSGGSLSGRIRVGDLDPVAASPKRMSRAVGFVFQDPESQFVMDTVEDDIAFTLENAGIRPGEIPEKVAYILEQLKIEKLIGRKVQTLSGGEQQKAAIASALVLSPGVLVLDEPTSQLDPQAAHELLQMLVQLKNDLRLTVLVSEHRLERVLQYADRLIYFDAASGTALSGAPQEVLPGMSFHPPVVSLGLRLGWKPLPLSIRQAKHHAVEQAQDPEAPLPGIEIEGPVSINNNRPVLEIMGLSVDLGKQQVLQDVNLKLHQGEILALMGANGAGKTTLLRTIMGFQKPIGGKLALYQRALSSFQKEELYRQVGYIPQDPNSLLFADKVRDELLITLRNHHLTIDEVWLNTLLEQLGIHQEADRYPRDLSTGQRQRAALGAILVTKPMVILMDEPTRGMDTHAKAGLIDLLKAWRSEGRAILIITHDVELAAQCCDRVAILARGRVEKCGSPRDILPELGEFAPQMAQLWPESGWLTVEQVLDAVAISVNKTTKRKPAGYNHPLIYT